MQDLRVIILAAGKGTRMKSEIPKVLHKVCGRPILQYVLDVAKAVGSLKTYVVVGHKSEAVRQYLPDEIVTVEQTQLLGTADAVRRVEKHLQNYNGHVLILCGDTPLLEKETIRKIIKRHKSSKAACTFLTAVVEDPKGYGRIIRDPQGRAIAIREDRDAVDSERAIVEINVGVYCFRSQDLLKGLKEIKVNKKKGEFYLTDIIDLFVNKKLKIETIVTKNAQEGWGVNTKEDLAAAEKVWRQAILKDLMQNGITIVDPLTTYIDRDVRIGQDTIIRPFTFIENDVEIGSRCVVGPFARLRPGTRIGDDVEVGNFAEISRTKIGNRTLVKHFSFLGDALIGSSVNIGAGTVTANFDGQNKNVTRIADQAFIGSDAILVAPVKIGKKSVVGAGSVVTKGKIVPDGAMAVGVPARILAKRSV